MMASSDDETFIHLPREKRQQLTDLIQGAHKAVAEHERKPGKTLHTLSQELKKHKIDGLADELWETGLKGGGAPGKRLDRLKETLGQADTHFFQLHRTRKFNEVAIAEAGLKVKGDMTRNRWLSHRAMLPLEELGKITHHIAGYLEKLTPHERELMLEHVSSRGKSLPFYAHESFGSTLDNGMVHTLIGKLLVRGENSVTVTRDISQVIEDCSHFCVHEMNHRKKGRS